MYRLKFDKNDKLQTLNEFELKLINLFNENELIKI